MPLPRKSPFPRLARVSALALAVGIGCRDAQAPRAEPDPAGASLSALIVSNPAELAVAANPGATPGVVYASLPPGSVPDGESVVIQTRGTGAQTATAMVNGGFDPVPVTAAAGDTLEIQITLAGTGGVHTFISIVPERRPPVVVRTDPPPKRRDVPLSVMLRVVFSEPIDAATVSPGSVELLLGGVPVPGSLGFADAAHLTVTFTPVDSLAGGAEYTLLVTTGIADLDGDPLGAPLTVTFTTVTSPREGALAGRTFEFLSSSGDSGRSRLVFYEDGRFSLQWQSPEDGFYEFLGSYSGDSLLFDDHARLWTASVTQRGDSLIVRHTNAEGIVPVQDAAYRWVPNPASPRDAGGRIAFASDRDGSSYIYVANPDGSNLTRLAAGTEPAWSWDGQRIAFTWRPTDGSPPALQVMDADGSNQRGLGEGWTPAWSPDGSQIAFSLDSAIMVMNADGSNRRVLITRDQAGILAPAIRHPTWSPDGRMLAFDALPVGDTMVFGYRYQQVYVMDADGSNLRQLNESWWSANDPAWSGDGAGLMVQTYDSVSFSDGSVTVEPALATYDLGSGGRTVHYNTQGYIFQRLIEGPDQSPDGRYLVFPQVLWCFPTPRHRVLILDRTTGMVFPLTTDVLDAASPDYQDHEPAWSRH